MSDLPTGWADEPIDALGEIVGGGTPSRAAASFWGGSIPWVTPTDITALTGKYVWDTPEKITDDGLVGSAAKLLPRGAIVVTTRATLGEAAIAAVPLTTNQGFKNIIPNETTDAVFTYFLLKTLRPAMLRLASGTTFPEISKKDFSKIRIQRPIRTEQKRIGALLETADEAIAKTEAVIAKLRQVRTGLIHDLLTCGLDENGHLRDPIAHPEQFQDTIMGLRPRDWEIAHIGIKCETYAGGTPPRGSPEFFGGSVPWIKSGEVNQDAISTTEETLSEQGLAISSAKWIAPGNPLMAMYGATAGQVSWLTTRATANQAVLAIIPRNDETVARFLFWMLRFVAPQIINLATGSGQPNLSKGLIDKALVAIPRSPDEQRAIATTIDAAVAIEKSETANLEKLIQLKTGLMDDLLTGRVRVPEST
jgi:type I restriction enzyme S subunit